MGSARGETTTSRLRWANLDRQQRRTALTVGALLVVAFVVRVGFVITTPHLRLLNDPADYERLGASLANGHGWGKSVVAPAGGPTAFRPPLYPLFLAGIYAIFGVHVTLARLIQAVLGTVTVGLLGAVANELWGRRIALIAMAIGAVYPAFVLAGGALLSESLALPLELVSLLLLLRGRTSRHRVGLAAAAGAAAGAGVLNRPNSAVLLLPFVLLALRAPAKDSTGSGRGTRGAFALVAVAALVIAPWMIRDRLVMHHLIPLTTQTGLTAAGTYNDTTAHDKSNPAEWRPPNFVPEYTSLLRGNEYDEERALRKAAIHYATHHPGYDLRVLGWNTLRMFDLTGPSVAKASWAANGFSPSVADFTYLSFLLVGLIAVGGAFTKAARKVPLEIWLAPILLLLVTIPFLGESRLRLPIEPFVVLLAALGVAAIVDRIWPDRRLSHP